MVVSLRERRRQMLRDEILQAVRVLVAEKGYTAMSMDELAARVGISKPTLYSHFESKEDLIVAAAQQSMERVLAMLATDNQDQTPLQRLVLLLRTIFQILLDEGLMASQLIMMPELTQLIRSREETAVCIQRIDSEITALVKQGIEQGEIAADLNPNAVTLIFDGMISIFKTSNIGVFDENRIPDPTVMANTLVTIFERGIRAPGVPPQSSASDSASS
jgi:AcrR family transcriptional regulator